MALHALKTIGRGSKLNRQALSRALVFILATDCPQSHQTDGRTHEGSPVRPLLRSCFLGWWEEVHLVLSWHKNTNIVTDDRTGDSGPGGGRRLEGSWIDGCMEENR